MRDVVRTSSCERARAWASLRLDGELSELEGRLLEAHTSRCADCAAFTAELQSVASEIRATPPLAVPGGVRFNAWRHRPTTPVLRIASRAAAVATAAAAGIAMFSLGAGSVDGVDRVTRTPAPVILDATTLGDAADELKDMRAVRRAALLSTVPQGPASGTHTGSNPL